MVDNFTIALRFNSENVPKTVRDINLINQELEQLEAQNKAVQLSASQLAGIYELTADDAIKVQEALSKASQENLDASQSARLLAEAYGLSADEVAQVEDAVAKVTEETENAKKAFEGFVTAGAAAISASVGVFLTQATEQFSEFEQFENILQNAFGDPADVQRSIDLVNEFADSAAQDLAATEESFAKLINRGINPTVTQLNQLADIATSQGKSIDQLVEAILDAQTGENERLKEFGIQADATGELLQLSFRGTTVEVEKTADAISDAIFGLGDLQGVAGAASSRVSTLEGRLVALSNESTRVSRTFGQLIAQGIEPLIIGATDLLAGFNELPAAVQNAVTASTAFVGALAAAVTAISAYNITNAKVIAQEAVKTAVLGKNTALQIANAVATQTATAAQSAYAVATGNATVAQQSQIAALVGGAAAFAAISGAIGAVALNVNSFLVITQEARDTEEAIDQLQFSIDLLQQTVAEPSDTSGFIAYQNAAAQAAENVQAIEDRLGGVERFLDRLRQTSLIFDTTAAEAATNRSIVKFGELFQQIGEIEDQAASAARALENGLTIQPGVVENTVAAIDQATAALERQEPATRDLVIARDLQIERLQAYRDRITATTEGVVELTDETDGLKDKLEELNDTLAIGQLGIDQAGTAAIAALEEQRAAGEVSAEEYQTALANIERAGFQGRINLAKEKLAELEDLEQAASDPDVIEQLQGEIAATQATIDQDRINTARLRVEEIERLEKAEADAAKESAKEKRDAAIAAAKEETGALKAEREEQERIAAQAFEAQQRQQTRTFDDAERRAEENFANQQRVEDQQFEEQQRSDKAAFEDGQRAAQEAFDNRQRSQQETFNDRQRAEERRFQDGINAARSEGNREFDALEAEVNNRIALAEADTREARDAIRDRIEAEEEAAEIRRDVEADVLRQRNSILSDADTDLSPLEQARADFEAGLQAQEAEFQAQQQAENAEFEDAQRLAKQEFEDGQRLAQAGFEEDQRLAQQAFEDGQRAAESEFQEAQRQLQQAFEDQQRQAEAAFKDQQRQLDEASATRIAGILSSARNVVGQSLRSGGVAEGGLVQVHADEFMIPPRGTRVVSQAESRRLISNYLTSGGSRSSVASAGVGTRTIERKLDKLIRTVEKRPRPKAQATINMSPESTQSDAIRTALDFQRQQFRSLGL